MDKKINKNGSEFCLIYCAVVLVAKKKTISLTSIICQIRMKKILAYFIFKMTE